MFRVPLSSVLRRHFASMASPFQTPVEDIIRKKVRSPSALDAFNPLTREQVTEALKPTLLEISNNSAAHSHHRAMEGNTSKETHFRLVHAASMKPWLTIFSLNIVSDAFKSKLQPARHRMVYALLKEELDRPGGIHALQLRTKTPEEEAKQASRAGN